MTDDRIDASLRRHFARDGSAEDSAERVMTRLAAPLPRQKHSWTRLPEILLDWQFAPAWPRMAVLAGCAALGFATTIVSIDRFDGTPAQRGGDITVAAFAPEALTGLRP